MFEAIQKFFSKNDPAFVAAVGDPAYPGTEIKMRAWVVLLSDNRVGFIDHYKADGKFAVRPVNFETGRYYPNTSQHWTNEQRLKVPEELALALHDFRAAESGDIPAMYRESDKVST
jgi:hypothetical protein